jgi:hypothetical protein
MNQTELTPELAIEIAEQSLEDCESFLHRDDWYGELHELAAVIKEMAGLLEKAQQATLDAFVAA